MVTDEKIFGTDFDNSFRIDAKGDLALVSGINNAEQRIYNRSMTKKGELEYNEEYGNEAWTVIGETDRKVAENKAEIFEETCLKSEPVIEDIVDVNIVYEMDIINVGVEVKLINQTNTSNLVFGLEVS
ncbi:DUF2634 domain-containing protein [Methanobacterium sp.]|uniref:contractile injection system sheath initiator n=1 Tax=Methanobacterium sp. TaxID=2164 RepID=UPI003C733E1B